MSSNAAMDGVHVVYASAELPAPSLFARIAAQRLGCAWSDVLTGRVPRAHLEQARPAGAPDDPRWSTRDRRRPRPCSSCGAGRRASARDRRLPADPARCAGIEPRRACTRGCRGRGAAPAAQATGAAIVVVSQASRASSRALRSGESTGAATTDAGAESAQIERAAAVTLALGSMGDAGADGYAPVPIHGGKSRYSAGDRTIAAWFHGARPVAHRRGRPAGQRGPGRVRPGRRTPRSSKRSWRSGSARPTWASRPPARSWGPDSGLPSPPRRSSPCSLTASWSRCG